MTRTGQTAETYEKSFPGHEPLIAQHRFGGTGLLPAAVQLEMAVLAVAKRAAFTPVELTGVAFRRPVAVADAGRADLRLEVVSGAVTTFELLTAERAVVSAGSGRVLPAPESVPVWTVACPTSVDPAAIYSGWSAAGLAYGPLFRTVARLATGDGTAEAVLRTERSTAPWYAHPLLVDGVFQVAGRAIQGTDPAPVLPIGFERLALHGRLSGAVTEVTVRVRRTAVDSAYSVADALLLAPSGQVLAEFTGIRMRAVPKRENPLITRILWESTDAAPARAAATGTWVVSGSAAVAAALRAEGATVVGSLDEATDKVDGLVLVLGDELRDAVHGTVDVIKALGARQRQGRVFVVTEDGQPVLDGDRPVPARAAAWGLVRTAAIEYPGLRPRLVDLDAASAGRLVDELGDGPVEIAYRAGVRYAPRRVIAPLTTDRPGVRAGGRYLLLGGHGGLGIVVAERLAAAGASVVALVSRSGEADAAALGAVEAHGCRVVSYAADVSVPGSLTEIVAAFQRDHGSLHGVVHAAGTLSDKLIRSSTADDVDRVLRPKVAGTTALAAAVAGLELDFVALFASVSGTFGNLGQAGYAAANAYLDAVAHTQGSPWVAIDWGLWGETGMGVAVAEQLRARGVRPLGTREALDALLDTLRTDLRQVVIAHSDIARSATPEPDRASTAEPASPRQESAGGVLAALREFVAERLGLAEVDPAAQLTDHGMSSIMSVDLAEELSRRWGTAVPATLFLEYPDLTEVAKALVERHGVTAPRQAPETTAQAAPQEAQASARVTPRPQPADRGAIAVVAVSADLPGGRTLDEFWTMLRAGDHAFTEVPAPRWSIDEHHQPRSPEMTGSYCRIGAFVSDVDRLEPGFFGISVREAEELDPQQKLLLEHSWSVLDEAGMAGRRDIGVFVGATYTHFRDARGLDEIGPHTALGSMNALLANRVSFALDLTGPSQTVDTLCSSSLVAIQQAVTSLRAGQCGAAVVAACHVGLTPWYYRSLSQLGALSTERPRPFDDRANGFVPGEGAIAVLLKRLDDAERDGDHVWGVIRGAAVNHGGRGSGLSVPRGAAQADVVRAALADAGRAPADVSLIEAHGTATRLGDPIEVAALTEVFAGNERPIAVGAVKANIGHLEPAAGLAGLVKVLLCLAHKEIPPLAGFENPGAHVDLSAGVLALPTEVTPWSGPRVAGISAFGMGGTNAHIVVEEHVPSRQPGRSTGEQVVPVSAHTPQALARRAEALARFLSSGTVDAGSVAFSAAVGRAHLAHRIAVLGHSPAELAEGLRKAATSPGSVWRGTTAVTTPDSTPADLALRFAAGTEVDWQSLHPHTPERVVLPEYPFRPEEAAASVDLAELLAAHRVFGAETVPGALVLELGFARADALADVRLIALGTGDGAVTTEESGGALEFSFGGRTIARAETSSPSDAPAAVSVDELRGRCPRTLAAEGLYAWFSAKAMDLASPLTPITEIRFGAQDALVRLDTWGLGVAALDGALQTMAVLTLADPTADHGTYLPVSLGRATRWADPASATFAHVRLSPTTGVARRGTITLLDEHGRVLVSLEDVVYRPVAAPRTGALAVVLDVVRGVLHDPSVTETTGLVSAGMDSMLAAMVTVELERKAGVSLTPVDVLDARDCRALATTVAALAPATAEWDHQPAGSPAENVRVGDATGADPRAADPRAAAVRAEDVRAEDVAVIGLSCAVPGAVGPEELWDLLSGGRDEVNPAPRERWVGAEAALGGFLGVADEFDAGLFGFFPKQAEALDPQARWLLRGVWEAWESAGIAPLSAPRSTGVFVGASYQHYKDHNIDPELDAHAGLGNHNAFLANRVSHFLDLTGPSMTIDTLCSSSLVALHTAVRSLHDGECEQAVVAGVRLALSPLHYTAMGNLRALSPTGASRAFDADADGFVPGEGVVTVLLKPLAAALRDGDPVRAVIKGTAVNHGGRTSGFTVPNSTAQHDVIATALARSGVDPASIGLLEAHGTGTSLGDPIEVEGLTKAWRAHTDRTQFCAIGSLKSNVGHLEPAAGLAGLVKAVLAMEHGKIPPTLHVTRPNDHIRFEGSPFYVADQLRDWPRGTRRAAVSAFGMGGVNAHVVLEEAPARSHVESTVEEYAVRVSGATEEAVRELASRYAARFERATATELADLCHTANTGRSVLEFGIVVRGRSVGELVSALRAVHVVGRAEAEVPAVPGRRVSDLPTYPFARDRFWHHHRAPAPPVALRTRWIPEPAVPGLTPSVRVLGADTELGDRVRGLAGARDTAADVVVVIDGATGLEDFWNRLREVATLPAGTVVAWVEHGAAAVHGPGDPEAAARLHALRATAAESGVAAITIDLDPRDPVDARAAQVVGELCAPGAVVAHRRGVRFVSVSEPAGPGPAVDLTGDGFVLVTGGLGAVGRLLVERLVDSGARRIGILGRSAGTAPVLAADVEYRRCDVSDEDALAAEVSYFERKWGRLRGVVHASGGVNPIGLVRRRDWATAAAVTAPKIEGTLAVLQVATQRNADFVVLVSSLAGARPDAARGVVDYALANAYQLATADSTQHPGPVVTAHAWPNWTGTGMAADPTFAAQHSLTPTDALDLFTTHLTTGGTLIFPGGPAEIAAIEPAAAKPVEQAVIAASVDAGRDDLVEVVGDVFRDVLGTHPGGRVLAELGLDSITIAEITGALERRVGWTVDPGALLRSRTVAELAREIGPEPGESDSGAVITAVPVVAKGTQTALGSLLRGLVASEAATAMTGESR
ncbi:SDR family NAD(P)-dependent oxidoreductase [Actinokineospora cianjurensis]|uniref:Polyketide synthase PksL n=1 Tax=Actinokineospora cianjurensis TaxID=585224 RepID=A0A421B0L5_9PSEU|nr:SDR family NAD(P)-dependent oxidoreductase [Actinokineospora cianjurensis]RLK57949.1 polyketide synthase PksL [Actinokineospora cianjurensis]